MQFKIHHFSKIDSTNNYLKSLIDAPEFTCVVADQQTAGRGRYARSWHSAAGEGLYLSILLRPQTSPERIPILSLMAAVAVAETLIEMGVKGVDIKWPNDVLINERKACGILAEGASANASPIRVILGIGVNLNHRSFPDELSATATSILIETGRLVIIDDFRGKLLERIEDWYRRFQSDDGRSIIDRWQQLSTFARGKHVVANVDDEQIVGVTDGLTPAGAIRIVAEDGRARIILAGEITKLRESFES